jgi:hypothetical protein
MRLKAGSFRVYEAWPNLKTRNTVHGVAKPDRIISVQFISPAKSVDDASDGPARIGVARNSGGVGRKRKAE